MSDVATRAQVSVTTVSHVLNGTRVVAASTRQRVLAAIDDLKYYKNAPARLLARGRSDSLGLIISDIENPFFPELIKSFERACLEKHLEVILCTTNYDSRQAQSAVRRMIEAKVRGVAVMTSQLDAERIAELATSDTPVALLDAPPARRGRGNVKIDYTRGAREAVGHLRGLGHRQREHIDEQQADQPGGDTAGLGQLGIDGGEQQRPIQHRHGDQHRDRDPDEQRDLALADPENLAEQDVGSRGGETRV